MSDMFELDWVHIADTSYVIKYKFDEGYDVMVSDLISLYHETLNETEIQERFHASNPYAEMKTKVIVKNLSQCLKDHLRTKNNINLQSAMGKLILQLKFEVAEVSFTFDMQLKLLPAEKMLSYIIAPLVMSAAFSIEKYAELREKSEDNLKNLEASQRSLHKAVSSKTFDCFESKWLTSGNVPTDVLVKSFINVHEHTKCLLKDSPENLKSGIKSEKQALPNRCKNANGDKSFRLPSSQCKREIGQDTPCDGTVYEDALKTESSVKTKVVNSEVPVSQPQIKKKKKIVKF